MIGSIKQPFAQWFTIFLQFFLPVFFYSVLQFFSVFYSFFSNFFTVYYSFFFFFNFLCFFSVFFTESGLAMEMDGEFGAGYLGGLAGACEAVLVMCV